MSSETSTSEARLERDALKAPTTSTDQPDALQPWQLFTLAGLIGATITVFMAKGQNTAGIVLLSLAVFAAAFVGLAALRTFLPLTGVKGADAAEMLGGRTRVALEREKTLILRSLKELEFDRGLGKVSEKDFTEMASRLRARAARLMRQLDAGSLYRDEIEREVSRRLGSPAGSAAPVVAAAADDESLPEQIAVRAAGVCAACDTHNDPDAKFCKNCGARLEGLQ